jgi:hypothetical protein
MLLLDISTVGTVVSIYDTKCPPKKYNESDISWVFHQGAIFVDILNHKTD